MALFLGIDSGTQSVKAVVYDLESNRVLADGRAPHCLIEVVSSWSEPEFFFFDWRNSIDENIASIINTEQQMNNFRLPC